MKKEDKFIGIDGTTRDWKILEIDYLKSITRARGGNYKGPIARLTELLPIFTAQNQQTIIRYLRLYFHKIILLNPNQQLQLIKDFDNKGYNVLLYDSIKKEQTSFGKKITWAFRYKEFRENELVELADYLNIKACLYCNSQYTLVVEQGKSKIAKLQFDHFFPKSLYPYLSISLYNLIPSCASCNHSKLDTFYNLNDFTHPYLESFHKLFNFSIPLKSHTKLLMGNDVPTDEIKPLIPLPTILKVKNYDKVFHLTGIYQRHTDIAKEIYYKAYAYKEGGKEALMKLEDKTGRKLFKDESEIQKMLLANYTLDEDINKRPLTKFMQDMARNSGLIK